MERGSACRVQRGFVRAHSFTGHSPIVRTGGYRLLSIAAATLLCISWAIAPVHCTQTLNTGLTDKHDHGEGANLPFGRHPGRGCLQERAAQGTQRPLLYKGAASVGSQQGPAQGRSTSRRRLLSEGLGGSSRDLRVEHPQELGIDILGESLESVRLFIHDQYNRFPPRDEESASSEPSGMGEGFVVCPAQSCPEMTSCQGRGDPTLSSCWNPHLEDMPVRSRPPVVRHFHPWDMNLNALDLCFENVTGAFGDVVRPGCPWKGDWLGGREDGEDPVKWWQEGWAGQVFELHNVYLDSQGRIFNKTHRFDAGGCLPRSKFSYGPGTQTTHFKEVLNIISPPPDLTDNSQEAHDSAQRAAMLDSLIHELPLLLPVIRALPAVTNAVLATRNKRLHRVISKSIFGPELFQGKLGASLAPKPGTLWRVSRLIQPIFQPCRQPSPALWRRLRTEYLLSRETNAAAALAPLTPPLIPPSTPCIPRNWTIVLHHKLDASLADHGRFRELVTQFFPADRVHATAAGMSLMEEKKILTRAALFITSSVPSISSVIFMPPNSTLLLFLPIASPSPVSYPSSSATHKHTSSASLELALGLARACEIRTFLTFCAPVEDNSALSNCSMPAVMEVLDRVSQDAYSAHKPLPVTRPSFSPETPAARPDAQAHPGWFNLPQDGVTAYKSWARCVSGHGKWVLNPTPRVLPWEYTSFMNLCDHRHFKEGGIVTAVADKAVKSGVDAAGWNVRKTLKYEWRVSSEQCAVSQLAPAPAGGGGGLPFAPFSGHDFCQLVGKGRTFLLLGDSLQDQMTAVFLNNMLRDIPKPAGWAINETIPQECIDWLPPGGNVPHIFCRDIRFHPRVCPGMRLLFVRSDFLLLANPRVFDRMEFTRFSFLKDVDVAVVNRGAHYEPTPKYERDLTAFLRYVRNRFPGMLVVYRNSPPGHKDCDEITEPLVERQDPDTLPFNWGEFKDQNAIAERLVEENGYVYMDVDTMTALRGDGHKGRREDNITDCLHYCTPGPIDVWMQHLYNTLLWVNPVPQEPSNGPREGEYTTSD